MVDIERRKDFREVGRSSNDYWGHDSLQLVAFCHSVWVFWQNKKWSYIILLFSQFLTHLALDIVANINYLKKDSKLAYRPIVEYHQWLLHYFFFVIFLVRYSPLQNLGMNLHQ